jgi:hypothetical protein
MTREEALPQIEVVKRICRELADQLEKAAVSPQSLKSLREAVEDRACRAVDAARWCGPEEQQALHDEGTRLHYLTMAISGLERAVQYGKMNG